MPKILILPIFLAAALGALSGVASAETTTRIPLETAPDQGDFQYRVQRGDTVRLIASRYLLHASDVGTVLQRNRLRNARRLTPGSTIAIPRRLLIVVPARAILSSYRGVVSLGGDRPAKVGAVVSEGARIQTGANSSVSFTLEDGSTVTLPSQSVIHVDRLRLVLATGEMQQIFRLEDGRSEYVVAPHRGPASKFEVRTPVSVSAVRGTEFRIGYAPAETAARAEVLKDSVAVSGAGAGLLLDQGYGAKSSAASAGTAVKLLPPPQIQLPIVHKPDGSLTFTVAAVEKATRYRFQIAADRLFHQVSDEMVSDTPVFTFAKTPSGNVFVRVTAIDGEGLEGLPHVYPFVYTAR